MEGQPSLLNTWDSFHKSYKDNTPLQVGASLVGSPPSLSL
jgi:hypothetical protein